MGRHPITNPCHQRGQRKFSDQPGDAPGIGFGKMRWLIHDRRCLLELRFGTPQKHNHQACTPSMHSNHAPASIRPQQKTRPDDRARAIVKTLQDKVNASTSSVRSFLT